MNKKAKTNAPLNKDESAFIEKLILENHRQIERIIYNVFGPDNKYYAEDAVNELYLRMCENVKTLLAHECPEAWTMTAARRTAHEMKRKQGKDALSVPIEEAQNVAGSDNVSEDVILGMWLEDKVPEKLISDLSKREREIYYKLYVENKKPKDVAKELDISVNAVNNIHKNLRDKIKDRVKRKNF